VSRSQVLCLRGTEEAPYRGPAETQLARDGRLTQACGREPLHVRRTVGDTRRPAVSFALAPGLRNAGFDALAQNLPLKLRKERERLLILRRDSGVAPNLHVRGSLAKNPVPRGAATR